MSIIRVKFDDALQQSDIIIPLTYSSESEAQEVYQNNQTEIQQTLIYGIQAPLIMINNIVVNFPDVISFELTCDKPTPEVHMVVNDRYQLSTILDTPGIDNELRIQILPKWDNIYKKINLTFYITQMRIKSGTLSITGEYKLPKFTSSNIKSFGETSIYNLFQTVAQDSQLGFATNVEDDSVNRYMYCDNKSYKEILREETMRSCTDDKIYEWWIDWWNYLILADVKERYNATDSDEDMLIWSSGQNQEVTEGSEIEPIQTVATLHNHPAQKTSEMYVSDYKICNSPGSQMYRGTDRVFSIYELNKEEYMDHLIMDGDTQKDVFCRYEYLGEVYGEQNYLLGNKIYETFKQKITTNETIEVTLNTPLLGIMRGNHVNFFCYMNNGHVEDLQTVLKEKGATSENVETNIPFLDDPNIEENIHDGHFVLDKSVSGQYLVTKCSMRFKDGRWGYVVTLSRPAINKPKIINEE